MFRWKTPGAHFVIPAPIGMQHRPGADHDADDHHGVVNGHPHWPLGFGRQHAANTDPRPKLTGRGYVSVFDQNRERGEMIAGRIREELERPLARRIEDLFRVRVVPREAAVEDVRSLHTTD